MSAEAVALVQRRVRREIRRQRLEKDQTQHQVADAMGWSVSKVIRMEQGSVKVAPADLFALLKHFGQLPDNEIEKLVTMVKATGSGQPYWLEYRHLIGPEFREFLAFESVASRLLLFSTTLFPGLLQTPAYMNEIFSKVMKLKDEKECADRTALRSARQEQVLGAEGKHVEFLLDESILRRRIGSRETFAHQLEHVLGQSERSGVLIRVLPMDVGAHPGLLNSFVLIDAADYVDEGVLYVESPLSELVIRDNAEVIDAYSEDYRSLQRKALSENQSRELVKGILDGL